METDHFGNIRAFGERVGSFGERVGSNGERIGSIGERLDQSVQTGSIGMKSWIIR